MKNSLDTRSPPKGPYIEVSENKVINELEEIQWARKKTSDKLAQFQCCFRFAKCDPMAVSPTIGDAKSLKKIAETNQVTNSETS